MNRLAALFCLLSSFQALAAEEIQVSLSMSGDNMRLYQQLSRPGIPSLDENSNSVVTKVLTLANGDIKLSCSKTTTNAVIVKHSCTFSASLGAAIKIAPTGAVIADLDDADSSKLFNTLIGLKTYTSLEKVETDFGGKKVSFPRLGITCPDAVSNSGLIRTGLCRIAAFR